MLIKMPIPVSGVQCENYSFHGTVFGKMNLLMENASKSCFVYCNTLHVSSEYTRVKSHRLTGSHMRIRVPL